MKRLAQWLGTFEPVFRNLFRLAMLALVLFAVFELNRMEEALVSASEYESRIKALEQSVEDLSAAIDSAASDDTPDADTAPDITKPPRADLHRF